MTYVKDLWKSYHRDQNPRDREKLVLNYLGLVKYAASRLAAGLPDFVDMDDLVGAGMMGLMKAIESFDPKKEVKFETYALPRIRGAMLDELRSLDWFPRSVRRKARMVNMATEELEGSLGRSPTDGELARHLDLELKDFYRLVGEVSRSNLISLEEEVRTRQDGTYTTVRDTIPDAKLQRADDMLADKELRIILADTLRGMPERERLVLTLYYFEELTLAEIGESLGVTESRICQIHGKAVRRLRTRVKEITREQSMIRSKRKEDRQVLSK